MEEEVEAVTSVEVDISFTNENDRPRRKKDGEDASHDDGDADENDKWWWKTNKTDKKQRRAEKEENAAFKGKKGLQTGTGLHLDCNPYNLWEKELDEQGTTKTALDRFDIINNVLIDC